MTDIDRLIGFMAIMQVPFATICGTDCDHYSDAERWKAFLVHWMEGLDAAD